MTGHAAGMIARWCGGLTAACVLSAAAFLAGCSSSTTANNAAASSGNAASASASSKAAVCKSAQNLKASITGLKDLNVRANGISVVSDQATKIKQNFATLKTDAKGEFSTELTAMSNALKNLGSSVDAAKANQNGTTMTGVATAAASVVTAGTNLVTAVTNTC
jgi:hypothetical protein